MEGCLSALHPPTAIWDERSKKCNPASKNARRGNEEDWLFDIVRWDDARFVLILSNHYVGAAEEVQGVPRATTVLTKMMSLRAQATRASVCGFPAARRRL